ncbi:MAG TPA: flagellar biosynthesis anti-sigma factor FlgM [Burkholderiales bacterium]|nr:flagellar biosynthesis anti-sigma factor FlgM [Burkholderiales bacterium]
MKIDPSLTSPLGGEIKTGAGAPKKPGGNATSAADTSNTDVHLSPLAAQLQTLSQELQGGSEAFDPARVAEIKQAISEGRLKIDPGAIADKLIETARELLQPKA